MTAWRDSRSPPDAHTTLDGAGNEFDIEALRRLAGGLAHRLDRLAGDEERLTDLEVRERVDGRTTTLPIGTGGHRDAGFDLDHAVLLH